MLSQTANAAPTTTQQDPLVLKYSAPAPLNRWQEESLPIGNGALGASIFGQVANDEVFLNEKTLWTGGPGVPGYRYGNYPEAEVAQRRANLQEVRDVINTTGEATAGWVAGKLGQPKVGYGNYQSFGKLMFAFNNGVGTPTDYERSLDIDNSVAKVTYKVGETTFTREYIASYPDNVVMMKISADKPGAVNFTTTYDKKLQSGMAADQQALSSGTVTASGSRITLAGTSPNNGLKYNAQADVVTDGGTTTAAGATITVAGANSATIVWAAATDYGAEYNADITKSYRDGRTAAEVAAEVTQRVTDAQTKGWAEVKTAHQADYKAIYDRVKLDLNGAALTVPTNQARSAYRGTSAADRTLETMYYQYGRYLLISSSRDHVLGAANLQGVWNQVNNPPWSADYHTNINVQMNYWPALSGNMPETYDAYLDYIDSLVGAGATSAQNVLGIEDSWMVMNETTPFGFTGVFDWSTAFWFPEANAWLAQAFWWKYLYTGDEDFLRTTAYPMLKKTSKFWEQYLVEDPRDGQLVANPSYSPEHGPFVAGASMSQQIATELFQSTIEAAEVLGLESEVTGLRTTLADTDDGLTISEETGMLLEWKGTEQLGEIGHRHVSHLYALWPGRNISVNTTPELAEAARKSLVHRGDGGTGWSMAWKINFWAKLFDGDHAHQMVKNIISNSTYPNLWDAHPPFQIDGNFGATSGINEMLVANDPGLITVLPAVPAAWADGSFDGIKAWNDVTVGATWSSGATDQVRLTTGNAGPVKVKTTLAGGAVTVRDGSGATVASTRADGVVSFTATAGGTYTIDGNVKVTVADAPDSLVYSTDGTVTVNYTGAPAGSELVVEAPEGWQVSPVRQLVGEGDGTASFTVRAPNTGTQGTLRVKLVGPDLEVSGTVGIQLVDPSIVPVQGIAAWDSAEVTGEGPTNGFVSAAIDGNPSTFWHTQWSGGSPAYPHYIVLDLGSEKTFQSFVYTPRPKSDCGSSNDPAVCNGQIGGYSIQVPTAGTFVAPTAAQLRQAQYAQPADAVYETVASGTFEKNTAPKTVTFDEPVTARYVKLLATTPAAAGQAWAHAGELGVD
ncbi:glycoside hydrolase N-terminal domain-containing protein, partial [Tessaracoccus lubricantis]|uniref:glycosyl hydrolase family 95 catalytic domain-containing protein n=1 Tax=Tessaracoccus lubricantis TaxID=545543 RepID=UPI003642BF1D